MLKKLWVAAFGRIRGMVFLLSLSMVIASLLVFNTLLNMTFKKNIMEMAKESARVHLASYEQSLDRYMGIIGAYGDWETILQKRGKTWQDLATDDQTLKAVISESQILSLRNLQNLIDGAAVVSEDGTVLNTITPGLASKITLKRLEAFRKRGVSNIWAESLKGDIYRETLSTLKSLGLGKRVMGTRLGREKGVGYLMEWTVPLPGTKNYLAFWILLNDNEEFVRAFLKYVKAVTPFAEIHADVVLGLYSGNEPVFSYYISPEGTLIPLKVHLPAEVAVAGRKILKGSSGKNLFFDLREFSLLGENPEHLREFVENKIKHWGRKLLIAAHAKGDSVYVTSLASRSFVAFYRDRVAYLVSIALVMLVVAFFMSWWISSVIRKPVIKNRDILRAVSQGDLTVWIDKITTLEIGQVALEINEMIVKLREIVRRVRSSAFGVESVANELSEVVDEVVGASVEQSEKLAEVSGLMEELSSTTTKTADIINDATRVIEESMPILEEIVEFVGIVRKNAVTVNNASKEAQQAAEEGMKTVKDVEEGMKRIAESSSQIAEIISVVNDIADQTNLLALNAAIEAARAGEYGRGFAVVADEVGKLAERSAEAAKEIAQLIKRSEEEVNRGVELANQNRQAFMRIAELVNTTYKHSAENVKGAEEKLPVAEKARGLLGNIINLTTQATDAMKDQVSSVENITSSVEAVSALATKVQEETHAVSDHVSRLLTVANSLREAVGIFKLPEDTVAGSPQVVGSQEMESASKEALAGEETFQQEKSIKEVG